MESNLAGLGPACGNYFEYAAGPDDWHVEQTPYEGTELSEIGVTVNYESSEEGEEALPGNFMADFDLADGESLDSWPEGSWKWANGDLSSDPCGMPSASR